MIKKLIFFFLSVFLLFPSSLKAEVYNDYRGDYRTIPAYGKTVQWILESQSSTLYLRQNLGFSEDETAFIIPFKGGSVQASIEGSDPWKEITDKTNLSSYFAQKTVDFSINPTIYTKSNQGELFNTIKTKKYDLDNLYQKQVQNWLDDGDNLLFFAVGSVDEPRITWTKPIKIQLNDSALQIPIVWLRPEFGKITTAKNKIIYATDFEGSNGGWQDEFQGEGVNSLVIRDNGEHNSGSFSLKVQNKPGSINAMTTQTIGSFIPGEHYTFSAYVKNGTITSGTAFLRVMGDGLVQFTDGVPMYNGLGHEWQRISISFQARSAYHFLSLMAGGNPGQYLFWDDLQIEKGTSASEFRSDKVGTNNSTAVKEDLTSSNVDLDVMVLGNDVYSTSNPTLQKQFYQLNNKKFSFAAPGKVLSSIRGSISPVDTIAFMQFQKTDEATTALPVSFKPASQGSNVSPLLLSIIGILFLAIVLKHFCILKQQIHKEKQVMLVFQILYFAGWFINIVSTILLSVYFYGQLVSTFTTSILDSASVFFITAFIMSMAIFLLTFIYFLRNNRKTVQKISEIQIGVTIILIIISLSFIISDIYRIFTQSVNIPSKLIYFSDVMPFILLIIELGVLVKLYLKVKADI